MTAVRVFDPAMCCSTGICGPSVDPQLVRFAADLAWLESQGVSVERFNLSQQPAAFVRDAEVRAALESKGEGGLPLVKVDDRVRSVGTYPSREELASWAGVAAPAASVPAAAADTTSAPAKRAGGCCGATEDSAPAKQAGGCCGGGKSPATATRKTGCC